MAKSPDGLTHDIERPPPRSQEAEMGVLGSLIISPLATIAEVVAQAKAEWFYVPAHQTIFQQLVDMWDKGKAIDLVTFTEHLRTVGQLEAVGGPGFVTSLFTFVPTAANVQWYLDIVREKYLLREIIAATTEACRRAYDARDGVNELLDELEQKFINLGDNRYQATVRPMKDNVMAAFESIELAQTRKGGITGIATGFTELDRMTGGLQNSEVTVVASRPSMGKTALLTNIIEYVAVDLKLPVALFSLEMSQEQLTQRLLASRARVNLQKIRDGLLADRDYPALSAAGSKFGESKLLIDDSAGLSILELKARARRLKAQHDVKLIAVDYLQLLHSSSRRGQDNRQIEISEVSSGLKALAKELKIPVVVAAQLNRQPEGRFRGKPRLSDLRESGSIEQDADVVALLCRPEVYEDDDYTRHEMAGEAELSIAKQRNGPIGEVYLTFLKEFTRFETRAQTARATEH
jgi:replicative DNA helicase